MMNTNREAAQPHLLDDRFVDVAPEKVPAVPPAEACCSHHAIMLMTIACKFMMAMLHAPHGRCLAHSIVQCFSPSCQQGQQQTQQSRSHELGLCDLSDTHLNEIDCLYINIKCKKIEYKLIDLRSL